MKSKRNGKSSEKSMKNEADFPRPFSFLSVTVAEKQMILFRSSFCHWSTISIFISWWFYRHSRHTHAKSAYFFCFSSDDERPHVIVFARRDSNNKTTNLQINRHSLWMNAFMNGFNAEENELKIFFFYFNSNGWFSVYSFIAFIWL